MYLIFNMPMAGHMPVMLMLFNNRGIDNKRMENLVSEYAAFPVAGFCIAGPHIEALTLFSTELRPNLSFKNSTSHLYFYTCKEQLCERFAAGIKFTNKQTNKWDDLFSPFSATISEILTKKLKNKSFVYKTVA